MRSISYMDYETLYVDIGKELLGFEAEILRLYEACYEKEGIKKETLKIYGGNKETFTQSFINLCLQRGIFFLCLLIASGDAEEHRSLY